MYMQDARIREIRNGRFCFDDLPEVFCSRYGQFLTASETACRYYQKQLDVCDVTDIAGNNKYLVGLIETGVAKEAGKKAIEKQSCRMDHALKRLKEKRLWSDTFCGLEDICVTRRDADSCALIQILYYGIGQSGIDMSMFNISDTIWKFAIELTMITQEPKLFVSDEKLALMLEQHLPTLYSFVILATVSIEISAELSKYVEYVELQKPTIDRIEEIRRAMLEAVETNKRLESESEAVKKSYEAKITQLQADFTRANRRMNYLESQSEKQAAEIEALRAELAAKTSELESAQSLLADTFPEAEHKDTELESMQDEIENLPELPDAGIIFAGGHVNMVNKVQALHPGWRYIGCREKNVSTNGLPELIFAWYKHLSHPVFDKLKTMAEINDVKIVFLESTNIENLETEMRRAWAKKLEAEEGI